MPRGRPSVMISCRVDPDIALVLEKVPAEGNVDRTQMICQGVLIVYRDKFISIVGTERYNLLLSAATSGMEND
jgi:hypothetical protein